MSQNLIKSLSQTVDKIDENHLKRFISVIDKTIKKNNKIFICGNGGSASLSDHALCDWTKRLYPKRNVRYLILCQTNH